MNIVLLFNPRSGGGSRTAEMDGLRASLERDGHAVALASAGAPSLSEALRGCGLLVIAGGDGTLHHALPAAGRAGVAVYHWPTGTENLFARQFGMRRSETLLRRAIERGSIEQVDLGDVDGRLFALMCSVGPDAAVAHRLHRARAGAISRWTYAPHVLRELGRPPPRLRVWVDGEPVVDGARGMCIVANSRQYGARFDPAPMASMQDGLLDVVFMPSDRSAGVLWWLLRARWGKHRADPRLVYRTGREAVVANAGDEPAHVQCDGEATATLECGGGPGGAHQIVVRERALRVLAPA